MVNITELQNLIEDPKFWQNRNIVTVMGMPGSGISTVLSELSKGKEEDKKDESHMKYVYLNMYDIGKKTEYQALRHFSYELRRNLIELGIIKDKDFEIDETDFYKMKNSVIHAVKRIRTNKNLAIIIDNIENTIDFESYYFEFFRELALVKMEGDTKNIRMLIASDGFIDDEGYIDNLGKFYPFVYENVLFISGFEIKHISEVLEGVAQNKNKTATEIRNFSGGNPKIVDRMLDYYAAKVEEKKDFTFDDKKQIIIDDKEVAYILYRIWKGLSQKQVKVLSKIFSGKLFELNPTVLSNLYLIETGLISKMAENRYELGLKLLEVTLKDYKNGGEDSEEVEEEKGSQESGTNGGSEGFLTGAAADAAKTASKNKVEGKTRLEKKEEDPDADIKGVDLDKLSKQEYKVFQNFREKRWRLISKDEIANLMWGRKRRSRKDDWAIDQLMKRLRNKLGEEVGSRLYTVRGRGYRYTPL